MKTIFKIIILITILYPNFLIGQNNAPLIEKKIDSLIVTIPNLSKTIDLTVDGVSIQDFCSSLSEAGNINLSADPNLSISLINRFKNIPIKDVLLFLCKTFDLDIESTGSIIYLKKTIKIPVKTEIKPKEIKIDYDSNNQLLDVDLVNDTLSQVTKEISKKTFRNFIISPEIENKTISLYLKKCKLEKVIEAISLTGNLKYRLDKDSNFILEPTDQKITEKSSKNQRQSNSRTTQNDKDNLNCVILDDGSVKIEAVNAALADIIDCFASKKGINYSITNNELKGNATYISEVKNFDSLLLTIFRGTQYSYSKNNNSYSIGERQSEGLRETKMVRVQYRSVEKNCRINSR